MNILSFSKSDEEGRKDISELILELEKETE